MQMRFAKGSSDGVGADDKDYSLTMYNLTYYQNDTKYFPNAKNPGKILENLLWSFHTKRHSVWVNRCQ